MIKVIEASANADFTLDVTFNDGKRKRFDAKPYLDYEVFRELKSPAKFSRIRIACGTVQWQNYQDISPDTLYLEGVEILEDEAVLNRLRANLEA